MKTLLSVLLVCVVLLMAGVYIDAWRYMQPAQAPTPPDPPRVRHLTHSEDEILGLTAEAEGRGVESPLVSCANCSGSGTNYPKSNRRRRQ